MLVEWLIDEGVEVEWVRPEGIVQATLVGRIVKDSEVEVEAVVNRFRRKWRERDVQVDVQNADEITDLHLKGRADPSDNES